LNLESEKFCLAPIRKHRRCQQHPTYYKTECTDCDLIISIKWEWKYVGTLPTRRRPNKKKTCPFCDGTRLKIIRINEKDYTEINQQWDLADLSDSSQDNVNDWNSWFVCDS
jgi:hypothetical protein